MDFFIEENRIYLKDTKENIIAEIEFEETIKGTYNIYHTFVDESLRGKGVASKLVEEAIKEIKKKNGKITATCSYAKAWIDKHKKEDI